MNNNRRTVSVAKMLWHTNYYMKHSPDANVGERRGMQVMTEQMLYLTGTYVGFSYLNMKPNPQGISPIIPDESRVVFFVASLLRDEYNAYENKKAEEGDVY